VHSFWYRRLPFNHEVVKPCATGPDVLNTLKLNCLLIRSRGARTRLGRNSDAQDQTSCDQREMYKTQVFNKAGIIGRGRIGSGIVSHGRPPGERGVTRSMQVREGLEDTDTSIRGAGRERSQQIK